jgi:hypothetical protein
MQSDARVPPSPGHLIFNRRNHDYSDMILLIRKKSSGLEELWKKDSVD